MHVPESSGRKTHASAENAAKSGGGRLFMWAMAALCCAALCAGLSYLGDLNMAAATLSLTYEEGSDGRTPNGLWFDPAEIGSEAVARMAVGRAGIAGEMEPDALQGMVAVLPVREERIGMGQVSASYRVVLRLPRAYLQRISPEQLLESLCAEYRAWFLEQYLLTPKALALSDMSEMDYAQRGAYLEMMTRRTEEYLGQREASMGAFVAEDGSSLSALRLQAEDFRQGELAAFCAYIAESGAARDAEDQIARLERAGSRLAGLAEQYSKEAVAYRWVLEEYAGAPADVWVPVGGSGGSMSLLRAETGRDRFALLAEEKSAQADEMRRNLAVNEARLERLRTGATPSAVETAEAWASRVEARLSDIVQQVWAYERLCVEEKMGGVIVFSVDDPSLPERMHLARSAAAGCALCALCGAAASLRRRKTNAQQSEG